MKTQTPVPGEGPEVDGQEPCKAQPLPTPEEKMRQQAQAVLTDIIPINVTGKTPPPHNCPKNVSASKVRLMLRLIQLTLVREVAWIETLIPKGKCRVR